jgi:hypothetical protein
VSNVNLDFHRGYTPPAGSAVNLNFSLNPDGETTALALTMHVSAPTLHFEASAAPAEPVTATCTLTLTTVQTLHITAVYDNSVFRGPSIAPNGAWQEAAPLKPATAEVFQQSANQRAVQGESWQQAQPQGAVVASDFQQAHTARTRTGDTWQEGGHVESTLLGVFEYGIRLRAAPESRWQAAQTVRRSTTDGFQNGIRLRGAAGLPWQQGQPREIARAMPFGKATKGHVTPRIPWQEAHQAYWGTGEQPPVEPPVTPPPYDGSGKPLNFICPWLDYAGNDILLNFGLPLCPPVEPPDGDTVIVPVKRVYIVLNSVSLRRVDGNVMLPTFSMSLSIDADSWTWGFNASLPDTTLDAIEPGSDGTPVELEAVINGTAYRVLAEQISRDRTFGRAAIRVTGKGKSAILGAPYAPVKTFSNTQARTAQQLMDDALTVNGASIGWTVNWSAIDWLVPAGAWSHQGSYITALNAIAFAAGAYIQPHPNQKVLNVLSRYPTAPWNWGSQVPDFELPADVTTRESIEWVERPRYNRVFVSGQGQGVLGQVTRTGTAGDILAPMVTDALITHADAARQRGRAILGDTGRQAHLSLRVPVLAETGVIQPGKFVRYVDGGITRLGIVRSTSIDVSNPEVWQTIGVETHVPTA